MGRIKGVSRPAIATPDPRARRPSPTILLDAGANAECQPEWLVQFAQMGAVYARLRFGVEGPRVGLLSIGEEAGKGNPLVKETFALLDDGDWADAAGAEFVGNVEGRDLMADAADVVVTDGFTGNVALKTLEGGMRSLVTRAARRLRRRRRTRAAVEVAPARAAAALRHARPREHRWRDAPRRRRRLHHLPRLVVGEGHRRRVPGRGRDGRGRRRRRAQAASAVADRREPQRSPAHGGVGSVPGPFTRARRSARSRRPLRTDVNRSRRRAAGSRP